MSTAIGIDIGGTFIDIVIAEAGRLRLVKVSSTPAAPEEGVLRALRRETNDRIQPESVERIAHGSTVATNALLERTWARTALLTTKGFRDVLEIGRQNRPALYDLSVTRAPDVVPRSLRFEVDERIDANGAVLRPLDSEQVDRVIDAVDSAGVDSVAIVFLFSYLNREHEAAVGAALSNRLQVPVVLSSEVLPEFREYERTSTTAICAALRPIVGEYLSGLEAGAREMGLPGQWQIMQSSGSVTRARVAEEAPARILLSGPAAGVEGARTIGRLAGEPNLLTLDMGGTSADVALIHEGKAEWTTEGAIGGYPVALPMIGIHTIGAGGGSLAWIDEGGALRVGPASAGADPGPACYGRGGDRPTVTDAHAVLGHLLADHAIGGLDRLDIDRARTAIATIAEPVGMGIEEAAFGILAVADAAMERAIRVISVEKGYDPRSFALLAFGGAGPLHAVSVARGLSIPRVIVPAWAGVLSALGLLAAEAGHDLSQGMVRRFEPDLLPELELGMQRLRARGREILSGEGIAPKDVRFRSSFDLRYVGQSHEINVSVAEGPLTAESLSRARDDYDHAHRIRFGHAAIGDPVEIVAARVHASGPRTLLDWAAEVGKPSPVPKETMAWFDAGGPVRSAVMDRGAMVPGTPVHGPAVLVGEDATLVVPPGVSGRCDPYGSLILEL